MSCYWACVILRSALGDATTRLVSVSNFVENVLDDLWKYIRPSSMLWGQFFKDKRFLCFLIKISTSGNNLQRCTQYYSKNHTSSTIPITISSIEYDTSKRLEATERCDGAPNITIEGYTPSGFTTQGGIMEILLFCKREN